MNSPEETPVRIIHKDPIHSRMSHHRFSVAFGVFALLMAVCGQWLAIQSADAQVNALPSLQPDPTYVQIDKYDCPTGPDWSQASYDQLTQGCGPNQSPVAIAVNGETLAVSGAATWGPYEDVTFFEISEEQRNGYGPPHVLCGVYVPNISQPSLQYGGATFFSSWQVQPGESLYCQMFNYQTGGQFAAIVLHKFACPDSWDWPDPYAAPLAELGQVCTQPLSNVQFEYQLNGQVAGQLTTDQNGNAQWLEAPAGQAVIREHLPSGYASAVVHCSYHPADSGQNFAGNSQPVQMLSGDSLSWNVEANHVLDCYWFNFPTDQIQLYKHWCPSDALPADGASFDQYETACGEQPGTTATWTITNLSTNQQVAQLTPSGGPPGYAGYHQLVQDQEIAISEILPADAGYGPPAVFCAQFQRGSPAGQTYGEIDDAGTVTWTPDDGLYLICNYFNVMGDIEADTDDVEPATGVVEPETGNSVTVYKWNCEPGTEYGREHDYYQGGLPDQDTGPCETEHLNIPISLWDGDGEHSTTTQANGTQWDGVILDVNGSFQIAELTPQGYGEPMVFCGTLDDETHTMVPATGGTISIAPAAEPFTYQCNWFNVPAGEIPTVAGESGDETTVTVYKFDCESPVAGPATLLEWQEACDAPASGWTFTLTDSEDNATPAVTANGSATWSGVPLGVFTLTETTLPGWSEPVVWCGWSAFYQGAAYDAFPQQAPATGGVFNGEITYPGTDYTCYWFNIPGEETTVTVHKFECESRPAGLQTLLGWQEACDTPGNDWAFTLTDSEDNATPTVTANGLASWSDVPLGPFTVAETMDSDWAEPVVWCGWTAFYQGGVYDAFPQQVTLTDGVLEGEISYPGTLYTCYWFNIPVTESSVTVVKYNCSGNTSGFQTLLQWTEACQTPGNGRTFTLTDSEDNASDLVITNGSAKWSGVPNGEFTLAEQAEPGWGNPVVWCGWTAYYEGGVYDAFPQKVSTTGGVFTGEITYPGTSYACFWFNIPVEHSSVIVYKYICPEGKLEGVVPNPLQAYSTMCTTPGNGIEFTLETSLGESSATTIDGVVQWSDVPQGEFTITESLPPGYDYPIWFCKEIGSTEALTVEGFQALVMNDAEHSATITGIGTRYVCWVFNFPDPDREVEVYKWLCPEGYEGETYEDWSTTCNMPTHGVKFTLTDENGNWPLNTIGGYSAWHGVAQGDVTLDEQIPPGYFEPVIYCSLEAIDGAAIAEGFTYYPSTNGTIARSLDYEQFHWVCHVYNIPKGPGDLTIYKWLCPPGYDIYAWGADPADDCDQLWNDVKFTLDQPVGPNLVSETGDVIDGAVYFGGLDPGTYVVTETVPPGIEHVFVLNCTGSDDDKVHPYPLQWGPTLTIVVAGGDSIVCNWYNVPEPEDGWVTVYKYQCWTPTWKSHVDCEIYEHGATFELFDFPGNDSWGAGTTNSGGLYSWHNLPEGAYDLDEISHKPCKLTTTKHDDNGHIWVDAGEETVVKVYNCKQDTPPGKVPGKYPNTGAGPAAAVAESAAAQGTPEGSPEAEASDFYLISCLDAAPEPNPEEAEETEGGTEPSPTPVGGVEEFDLPIDTEEEEETEVPSDGSPVAEEECFRGALPERVVIDAAQVDAGVEILEIIDGVMEQPTGPELVTWYKETGRLGETNNVVIAGHLNYWGVPQGVFFYLDQLREGDRVEITGDDGKVYVFEVEWVRQESNFLPPAADVIGPTDVPSLTLITCGGEWNASISEYDERTVARAIQVEIRTPEDPS